MKTVKTKVYEFDELLEEAKEKAREWFREGGFDYEWWDATFEDVKQIGSLLGIEVREIYFSGFSSQGDGACFEGSYEYAKQALKKIREYAPNEAEVHRIAKELQAIQRHYLYKLNAVVRQQGHYSHKYCTVISVCNGYDAVGIELEEKIAGLLRDFMEWIYRSLEREWEWINSDEQVDETIRINEYTFTKDDERFG